MKYYHSFMRDRDSAIQPCIGFSLAQRNNYSSDTSFIVRLYHSPRETKNRVSRKVAVECVCALWRTKTKKDFTDLNVA